METLRKYVNHKYLVVFYLFLIGVTFNNTYDRIFDKKIHLGGDNAGYYIYGKAIAMGEGYTAIHTKEKPPGNHFPPGYSALIAGVMKVFDSKINTIKAANGFFMLAALMVLFFLFRALTKNIHLSFVACLFALFNFHLLEYSTIMMSEISFVLFSAISLLLFVLMDFEKVVFKNWKFYLFIAALTFAFYIRTLGISLVISFTLILLLKKRWTYAGALVVCFFLLALPWQIRSANLGGSPYVKQLFQKNPYRPELGSMEFSDWPERVGMNLKRYLALEISNGVLPFETIDYKQAVKQLKREAGTEESTSNSKAGAKKEAKKELTKEQKVADAAKRGLPNAKVEIETSDYIITLILLILMAIGLARIKEYKILIGLYLAGTFSILFLWPESWFGIRFMLPVVPILIMLALHGVVQIPELIGVVLKKKEPWVLALILPFIVFFSLYGKLDDRVTELEKRAKGVYISKFKNYFDIATWANKNLPKDAVVSCRKGQLFYVYGNRWIAGFRNTLDKEELVKILDDRGVTHVVLDQLGYASTSRYLYPAIKRYPGKFKVIHQLKNPDTYIMKFDYSMGYTGEWQDDKKQGQGTYRWPNNQVYEGSWTNNLRNGKGMLTMPDGSKLEGVWTNDILNGEVKIYDKEGQFTKTATFKNNKQVG
ncbi:glycosyltransferase family 39 protein [Flavobacteriales bacterium]|nr:glycosyltransferase family 39 protein [Flavobacteriales bacterium]